MPSPSKAIILAGSGRSGTTWIGNILSANPFVRTVFEPFDGRRVPEASHLPLRPYARPGQAKPEWESVIHQALTGKLNNAWVNRTSRVLWTRHILVKTIRATLLLGWLVDRFNPRIVYVLRHPCAVVNSRLKLGWETHLEVFLAQPELVADYLQPYLPVIESAETPTQKHAVMWAVENLVPLRQKVTTNWVVCTYEQFVSEPETEARRVLQAVGLSYSWWVKRTMGQVSQVARPGGAITTGQNPITEWQNQLTTQQIDDILTIIASFGIGIYGESPFPII